MPPDHCSTIAPVQDFAPAQDFARQRSGRRPPRRPGQQPRVANELLKVQVRVRGGWQRPILVLLPPALPRGQLLRVPARCGVNLIGFDQQPLLESAAKIAEFVRPLPAQRIGAHIPYVDLVEQLQRRSVEARELPRRARQRHCGEIGPQGVPHVRDFARNEPRIGDTRMVGQRLADPIDAVRLRVSPPRSFDRYARHEVRDAGKFPACLQ